MSAWAITGVCVTVGLFVLTHAGGTIWFLSKVNTTLNFVLLKMDAIDKNLASIDGSHMSKEAAAAKFTDIEKQLAALWKRHDEIKEEIYKLRGVK